MSNTVPEGWQIKKLGNLVDPRSSNVDKKTCAGEIPVRLCNYTDVYYRNRITSDIEFMEASAKQREIDRFSLEKGDVIITKDSETPGDIAVPAYVSEDLNGVVCGYHLTLLKPMKERSDGEFLSHLFQFPSVQHYFYILANGITRFGLTADTISEAPLLAPPLPEQQKIAAILSSVDDVIDKTRAQIDKLKDLKTGMMQELLTKGIGHTAFKDSPVGRIPEGWICSELGSLLTGIDSGWSPSCIEVPPGTGEWGVLKVSAVTRGAFAENESKQLPKHMDPREKLRVHQGDILLTRANGVADLVGKCVMVLREPQAKLMMSDKILRLNPGKKLNSGFLLHVFNSGLVRKQIENCWGGSSGQKNISQADIKQFLVPCPPIDEQLKIAKSISQIDIVLYSKNRKLGVLLDSKKALMQDLLTGKVRVNVDNKENAVA